MFKFLINGKVFDPHSPPRKLTLGAVEEWLVSSVAEGALADFFPGHPFHIHVNPFQFTDEQGRISCIREFNERGLVTKFIQIERETDSIKTSFSYDDEGRKVCSITTTSGSTVVYQTRYIYRKDRLHKQISYSDGHAFRMAKYKYRPIKGY